MAVNRRGCAATLLAGLAAAVCDDAQAASCSPGELMAKVTTLTDLLERGMQQPVAARRGTVGRMRAVMQRRQQGTTDYNGVCVAYDELIEQLRR